VRQRHENSGDKHHNSPSLHPCGEQRIGRDDDTRGDDGTRDDDAYEHDDRDHTDTVDGDHR
jgi:hypothetical protein